MPLRLPGTEGKPIQ